METCQMVCFITMFENKVVSLAIECSCFSTSSHKAIIEL